MVSLPGTEPIISALPQAASRDIPRTAAAQRCKPWSVNQATGFVGLSGAYDIPGLAPHLNDRGLHRWGATVRSQWPGNLIPKEP